MTTVVDPASLPEPFPVASTAPVSAAPGGPAQESVNAAAPVPTSGEEEQSSADTASALEARQPLPSPTEPSPAPARDVAPGTASATAGPTSAASPPSPGPHVEVRAEHNHGTMIGQLTQFAVGIHRGTPLPTDFVDRQLVGYAPAKNEGEAAGILYSAERVVVLVADTLGSGRWTTALKLLRDAPGEELTIRRVRREVGAGFDIEGLHAQEHTGWILDLRSDGDSVPVGTAFGSELRDTQVLKDTKSRLVVLVSTGLWRRIGGGATPIAVLLDPPDPVDVLKAYFDTETVRKTAADQDPAARADRWMQATGVGLHVNGLRPAEVRKWAEAIEEVEARHRASPVPGEEPDKSFKSMAATVVQARFGWLNELVAWHSEKERTSFERNYLLVRAVFGGRRVEDALDKVASLATALGEAADPPIGQHGPGLVTLTSQIGAELLPDGEVRFPGPGYAEAVVEYFWRDRPHLLEGFTKWTVAQCLELEDPDRGLLANQVIPWVLDHSRSTRSTPFLRSVAALWAEKLSLVPHAVDLLVMACLDSQIGSRTRDAASLWIRQPKTSPELKVALARVFQRLAPAYPTSLRRLAELAESDNPNVNAAVGDAINALWEETELRPRLRATLTTWLDSPKPALRQAAANTFLHLARNLDDVTGMPSILPTGGGEAPGWVIDGWRRALEEPEPTRLAFEVGTAWLDAVADLGPDNQVTRVLVRAVHDTPGHHLRGMRFLNAFRVAERWHLFGRTLDEPARNRLRGILVSQVEAADPRASSATGTG